MLNNASHHLRYAVLAALLSSNPALAETPPEAASAVDACASVQAPLAELTFSGNETTKDRTLLREVGFMIGQMINAEDIEDARQSLLDLRLFKSVVASCDTAAEGLHLSYRVREKHYIIPAPRADANSDGQYAYGAQIRWYNVWGLNHTYRATVLWQNQQDQGRGIRLNYRMSYDVPWLANSPWGWSAGLEQIQEPVDAVMNEDGSKMLSTAYVENTASYHLIARRHFPGRSASQGLTLGIGVQRDTQSADGEGEGAPPSFGTTHGLLLQVDYEDMRFNRYSETGLEAHLDTAFANDALASDYSYSQAEAELYYSVPLGNTPHQTLGTYINAGAYTGGADGHRWLFEVGGAHEMRGYERGTLKADKYLHVGTEYLRPLFTDGIRSVVFVEAARAWDGGDSLPDKWLLDVGLGVRIRFTSFVNFELNLGVAFPLLDSGDKSGGMRVYAAGRK